MSQYTAAAIINALLSLNDEQLADFPGDYQRDLVNFRKIMKENSVNPDAYLEKVFLENQLRRKFALLPTNLKERILNWAHVTQVPGANIISLGNAPEVMNRDLLNYGTETLGVSQKTAIQSQHSRPPVRRIPTSLSIPVTHTSRNGKAKKPKLTQLGIMMNTNRRVSFGDEGEAIRAEALMRCVSEVLDEMLAQLRNTGKYMFCWFPGTRLDPTTGKRKSDNHRSKGTAAPWDATTISDVQTHFQVEVGYVRNTIHAHIYVGIAHWMMVAFDKQLFQKEFIEKINQKRIFGQGMREDRRVLYDFGDPLESVSFDRLSYYNYPSLEDGYKGWKKYVQKGFEKNREWLERVNKGKAFAKNMRSLAGPLDEQMAMEQGIPPVEGSEFPPEQDEPEEPQSARQSMFSSLADLL